MKGKRVDRDRVRVRKIDASGMCVSIVLNVQSYICMLLYDYLVVI